MLFPALSYTHLSCGVIMMSASISVIYRVYKNSKSQFAYVLMAFTFIDGAQNFASFLIHLFNQTVHADNQAFYALNFYASQTEDYCYFLVSLQSWIFGMKYLESAMFCSLTPACLASQKVRYINWAGISIYTLLMLAMWIWCMVTFPGYANDNSV